MKKSIKTMFGVTLLEIMLVLAIAAMVIVLSIRYYQSATVSSQANAIMTAMQSITSAMDNVSQSTGSYTSLTSTSLKGVLPDQVWNSPWGTVISLSSSASSFTLTVPGAPPGVCALISPKLSANPGTAAGSSCSGGTLTYQYTLNGGATTSS